MKKIDLERILKALFCLGIAFLPAIAIAAGQEAASPSGQEAVTSVIKLLLDTPAKLVAENPFADTGKRLLYLILSILFSWKFIKILFDGAGINQLVGELVNVILLYGLAMFFLSPEVQRQIADGFNTLAATAVSAIGGPASESSDMSSQIASNLGKMAEAAYMLYEGKPEGEGSAITKAVSSILSGEFVWAMLNGLYRIFIALLLLLSVLIYTAQIIFAQIMVNIGLILAPIFIPWILWDVSNEFFYGWLKFMITAGLQKIVGSLLFGMTAQFVTNVTSLATQATTDSSTAFYYYSSCFLIAGVMAYLMMQIGTIANGLVSGSARAAFSPPQALTPGGGAARVGSPNMGKAASSGAKGSASLVSGAISGGKAGAQRGAAYGGASMPGKIVGGTLGAAGGAVGGAAKAAYNGAAGGLKNTLGIKPPPPLPKAKP